jgi:hypothetical protein
MRSFVVVTVAALSFSLVGGCSSAAMDNQTESVDEEVVAPGLEQQFVGKYKRIELIDSYRELDSLTLNANKTYSAVRASGKSVVKETGKYTVTKKGTKLSLNVTPSKGASRKYTVSIEVEGDSRYLTLVFGTKTEIMEGTAIETPTVPGKNTPAADCATRKGGAFITYEIRKGETEAAERFTVWSTNATFIEQTKASFAAGEHKTPNFDHVLDGTDCDAQYSWHVDPANMGYADFTIELCDGTPSYVDAHKSSWMKEVDRYCPWGPTIISIDERK